MLDWAEYFREYRAALARVTEIVEAPQPHRLSLDPNLEIAALPTTAKRTHKLLLEHAFTVIDLVGVEVWHPTTYFKDGSVRREEHTSRTSRIRAKKGACAVSAIWIDGSFDAAVTADPSSVIGRDLVTKYAALTAWIRGVGNE